MSVTKDGKQYFTIEESKKIISSYIETSADTLISELKEKQKKAYV